MYCDDDMGRLYTLIMNENAAIVSTRDNAGYASPDDSLIWICTETLIAR